MNEKKRFIEFYNVEREKFEVDRKNVASTDELLHLYARYCGRLEAMIMYIDIEVKEFR